MSLATLTDKTPSALQLAEKEFNKHMALGHLDNASLALQVMIAQAKARKAPCYFSQQGEADRARLPG